MKEFCFIILMYLNHRVVFQSDLCYLQTMSRSGITSGSHWCESDSSSCTIDIPQRNAAGSDGSRTARGTCYRDFLPSEVELSDNLDKILSSPTEFDASFVGMDGLQGATAVSHLLSHFARLERDFAVMISEKQGELASLFLEKAVISRYSTHLFTMTMPSADPSVIFETSGNFRAHLYECSGERDASPPSIYYPPTFRSTAGQAYNPAVHGGNARRFYSDAIPTVCDGLHATYTTPMCVPLSAVLSRAHPWVRCIKYGTGCPSELGVRESFMRHLRRERALLSKKALGAPADADVTDVS